MELQFFCRTFQELNLSELYQLLQLRQEVFIVEQDCPYLDADNKDQESTHLLGIDTNSNILAYARILGSGLNYEGYSSIGRVVTHPKIRRTGIGKELMKEAIKLTFNQYPDDPIKISAQVYALSFYEYFGFQNIGPEYLEDDIPHQDMILKPKHG